MAHTDTPVISRNGLRWCDPPREYGPPKTLYNRWKRWGDMGVFARMKGLASEGGEEKVVMIDATYPTRPLIGKAGSRPKSYTFRGAKCQKIRRTDMPGHP